MNFLSRLSEEHLPSFHQSGRKFLIIGTLLGLLGFLAIGAAALTTFLSVIFLGILLTLAGVFMLLDSMAFWRRKSGFLLHVIISLLYVIAGLWLVLNPLRGSISLTLLLGIFYIITGVFRVSFSSAVQSPRWGWGWFNGIVSLLIGLLILTSWPVSGLFIIGLLIGIDLVFVGWAYVMASMAGKKKNKSKKMAS